MKKLFSLFAACLLAITMVAKNATIYLDGAATGLSGTATAAETSISESGITYNFSKGAKIQSVPKDAVNAFNKNAGAILIGKENAYIYNTKAFGDSIASFKVYYNKSASAKATFSVTFSRFPITAAGVSGSDSVMATLGVVDSVFDCTDQVMSGAKYFYYKVTNANNTQVQFEINYAKPAGEVDAPAFTPTAVNHVDSVIVSLTQEDATAIYYTIDGTEPSNTNGVLYEAPFVVKSDLTVKAIAYNNTNASEVSSMEYKVIAGSTCAQVNAASKGTKMGLKPVTVVYVNGANAYLKDASGSTLLYLYNNGLKAGDQVSNIIGEVDVFNGLPELKPSNATDWTIVAGEAPAIEEATAAPVAADVNKVLVWKGVKINGTFTTDNKTTLKGVFGTDTIAFYNNFKIAQAFDAANDYDITGAVSVSNDNVQVYYISCVENKPMQGAYTIGGEDADFASLYEACEAVKKNMLAGKVAGDVELLIAANLDNQKNVGIFNNTEHTITIRPDKDEPRTITFSATTDANVGPSGAIMIGIKNGTLPHDDAVASQNIIIDGLASETATNKMVITTTSTYHNSGYLVVMYGQVTNSVVRNCVLTNNRTTGSTYAVCFRSQKDGYGPKGAIVENCEMNCIASTSGQGVNYNGVNNNALDYPDSCIVRNNIIRVKSRGVFLNGGQNAFIEGNEFYVDGAGGFLVTGIYGNKQKGETHVRNNRFLQLQTANKNAGDYGVTGILASGGGTWEITNNLFTGFELTQDAANGSRIVGIRCGNACTVRHNTFIMNELSHHPGNAYKSTNPVACIYAAAAGQTIQNNIFVVNETESNASCYRGALEANTTGNNFFVKVAENSKAVYVDGASTLATYAQLDSAQRADNRNIDPQFTDGYIFESKPAMKVAAIAGITLDIDGNERGTVSVYPGCYEPEEDPTEIEEMVAEEEAPVAKKVMINGHIYILRGEKMYDMNGRLVK